MIGNRALIGVGSNIDPERNTQLAEERIEDFCQIIRRGTYVRTPPVGFLNQPDFCNGALLVTTPLDRKALNTRLKQVEDALGRERTVHPCGPRTIDLDILLFNGVVTDRDIYERSYLKGSVQELCPEVGFPTQERNLDQYSAGIHAVVRVITKQIPGVLSVFGAGHWFADEACPTSDVDFVVVVQATKPAAESQVRAILDAKGMTHIGSYPIRVRLLWLEELMGQSRGLSVIAPNQTATRVYLRQLGFYLHLHGEAWPYGCDLIAPLPLLEELAYEISQLRKLPYSSFLTAHQPTGEPFDWPDLVKLVLFTRILYGCVYDGHPYDPSFMRLQGCYSNYPVDLTHRALAYREFGYCVPPAARQAFHEDALRFLTIRPDHPYTFAPFSSNTCTSDTTKP